MTWLLFFLLGGLSGIGPPGGHHKEINRVTGQRTFFAASVGREREKERQRERGQKEGRRKGREGAVREAGRSECL